MHAFQYLKSREYVDSNRVGMGGFCVGASFALVAAADPRIRRDVVFVNAFGPYFKRGRPVEAGGEPVPILRRTDGALAAR